MQFIKTKKIDNSEVYFKTKVILNLILAIILIIIPIVFLNLYFFQERKTIYFEIIALEYILCLPLIFINIKGFTKFASYVFIIGQWIILTLLTFISGGITSLSVNEFLILIIVSGFLLGRSVSFYMYITFCFTTLFFVIIELYGLLPANIIQYSIWNYWVLYLLFALMLFIIHLYVSNYFKKEKEDTILELDERKKIVETIKNSESKFRAITENTTDFTFITDKEGRYTYISPSIIKFTGFQTNEILGNFVIKDNPLIEIHPDDITRIKFNLIRSIRNPNKTYHIYDFRIKNIKEEWVYLEGYITYLPDVPGVNGFVFNGHDTIERKKYEQAILESNERFRVSFMTSPDSISISTIEDGIYLDVNSSHSEIFGYNRDELIGKSTYDLNIWVDPNDRKKIIETIQLNGIIKNIQARLKCKNGSIIIGSLSACFITLSNVQYVLIVTQNITDLKRAEEALMKSEEKFSKAFQNSPAIITISRLSDKTFIDISESFEHITGYNRQEVIGTRITELNIFSNPIQFVKISEEIKNKRRFINKEVGFLTKTNKIVFGLMSSEIINLDNEDFVISVIIDITDRKIAEEKIEIYQNKLKSLTTELTLTEERERRNFAVNLHDHIIQSLAMSKIKIASVDQAGISIKNQDLINEAKDFLSEAIKNSRNITYELSPPILYEIGLPEAVSWLLNQIEKNNKIKTVFINNSTGNNLDMDIRILLYRSISELITNCVKHSNCATIIVKLWSEDNKCFAEVSDDGIGFEHKSVDLRDLTDSGFGLFSIKERLDYSFGEIKIYSSIGNGTKIILSLPETNVK